MKHSLFIAAGYLALVLAACTSAAPTATAPPTASPTPFIDPCAKDQVATEVKAFTELTREFDDTSYVASFTPKEQLVQPVLKLQDVRRRVQAIDAASCFADLKELQVDYMNGVITALVHFLGGARGEQVQAEIAATRSLRVKYEQELANVLGVTYVPPPTQPPRPTAAPASATPAPATATPTPEQVIATVIQRANLRLGPGTEFEQVAILNGGEAVVVTGKNQAGDWLQVQYPAGSDERAWLLAALVTVTGPVDTLPVATP